MAEIGYRLIRAREARGLTLEDAERDTRISRRYLEALEDEQFELIPAPVYARGFLRSYAQYLGMDPQEILALFPRDGELPSSSNGVSVSHASMTTPIPATSPSRPTWRKPPKFDSGRTRAEPRNRRREPPPPPRGAVTGEVVIGGDPIPPQPLPRSPGTPQLDTRPSSARRAPSRTVVSDAVIGQDIQAQPKRSHPGAAADRHRNLIVIGATAAAILVVGIAAFLIATLGGDDSDPAGGTGSPSPEQSETVTSTADATGTGTTTGALPGVVPSVIGQSQSAAVEAVESAGLEPRIITSASAEPEGTVIDQSPAAGTQLQQGAEVRIVVSTGQ